MLGPFLGKPVHLDDPMYIWAARRIAAGHWADPYGFDVNWRGWREPMAVNMQNPPGVCYYMAVASKLFGWGEVGLHAAFLLPAVLAVVGTAVLANRFCRRPVMAAVLMLATPAVLVSATTLMCELPLLAAWVWAVVLWVRGSDADTAAGAWPRLLGSGLLVAVAVLVKYPGVNLFPLLVGHAVICPGRRRRAWVAQAVALLVPVAVLVAYDRGTAAARHGPGAIVAAVEFTRSHDAHVEGGHVGRAVDTLAYVGGGGLTAALVIAAAVRRRWTIVAVVTLAGCGRLFVGGGQPWWFYAEYGLLAAAGVAVLAGSVVFWLPLPVRRERAGVRVFGRRTSPTLGTEDPHPNPLPAYRERGPETCDGLFLLAWVVGVAVFAGGLNWSINVRSVVPMMPAVAILAMRVVDRKDVPTRRWTGAAGVGLAVAVAVAVADYQFAVADRAKATAAAGGANGRTLWFVGHWGFQYYLEPTGARPIDGHLPATAYAVGDLIAVPSDNNCSPPVPVPTTVVSDAAVGPARWAATVREPAGANWYYSPGTLLPFVFGPVPPATVRLERVVR